MSCPSGTFENNPAIYGWVAGHPQTQSPEGTAEAFPRVVNICSRSADVIRLSPIVRNQPKFNSLDQKANQKQTKTDQKIYANLLYP
jgi:hypothetical protein